MADASLMVWIDQDLCTGDGLCIDHCPDIFVLLEDGISYVRDVRSGSVVHDPGGRACTVAVPQRLETVVTIGSGVRSGPWSTDHCWRCC